MRRSALIVGSQATIKVGGGPNVELARPAYAPQNIHVGHISIIEDSIQKVRLLRVTLIGQKKCHLETQTKIRPPVWAIKIKAGSS